MYGTVGLLIYQPMVTGLIMVWGVILDNVILFDFQSYVPLERIWFLREYQLT
jgi:hypothetical protein